jgi:hypothetical protein
MTELPNQQLTMSNLEHSGLLSAASLEKLEGQLVACSLEESDSS